MSAATKKAAAVMYSDGLLDSLLSCVRLLLEELQDTLFGLTGERQSLGAQSLTCL